MKVLRVICISLISTVFSAPSFAEAPLFSDDDLLEFEDSGFDLPAFDDNFVPVVLTATRIQQHQSDVPASVTILDSDFIMRLGTNNLAEVLRYVPGIMMGPDKHNNVDSLNYHGGESALPKNLQVLVDGRSMYRAGLSSVSWYEMPVAIQDIDRIEVVRGPNSASYGANAYQAVINILTKHPSDTYGTRFSYESGESGQEDIFLRQGGKVGKSDYRMTYTQKRNEGFDSVRDTRKSEFMNAEVYRNLGEQGELEVTFILGDARRDLDNQTFQVNENFMNERRSEIGLQWTKDFSSKHQLLVKAYATYYEQDQRIVVAGVPQYALDNNFSELMRLDPEIFEGVDNGELGSQTVFSDKVDAYTGCDESDVTCLSDALTDFNTFYFGLTNEEKAEIGLEVFYPVAVQLNSEPLLDDYISSVGATLSAEEAGYLSDFVEAYLPKTIANPFEGVSGTVDAHLEEFRFDIEVQDTYIYSDELTIVSGASFRRDVVDSDHYFDGKLFNNTSRLFGSVTWKPSGNFNYHLGGMIEKEDFSNSVFSPRAAVNYKISPSESIRYVYSESVRSPDFFEQFADWTSVVEDSSIALPNGNTYFQVGRGPGELDHQKIRSNEIGYYGRLNDYALELDVRIFYEEERDVLYQSLTVDGFSADTDNTIEHTGIEWQIESRPLSDTLLRMTAAYVDVETSRENNGAKLRIYSKETASLTWMQGWGNKLSSTLNYFVAKDLDQLTPTADKLQTERLDGRISKGLAFSSMDADIYLNFQHDISSDAYLWNTHYYTDSTRLVLGAVLSF